MITDIEKLIYSLTEDALCYEEDMGVSFVACVMTPMVNKSEIERRLSEEDYKGTVYIIPERAAALRGKQFTKGYMYMANGDTQTHEGSLRQLMRARTTEFKPHAIGNYQDA